jgi:predicted neuraminidase
VPVGRRRCAIPIVMTLLGSQTDAQERGPEDAIVTAEFVFGDDAPFRSCHASTIVVTRAGPFAAWFAGTAEGGPDVAIWTARRSAEGWSAPALVADGVVSDGTRYPCWNPVLFEGDGGALMLFYKVGPSPRAWWGMLAESNDGGRTWATPRRLPDGQLGPVRNKPVRLASGELLCGSSTEHDGWRVHMERCTPDAASWTRTRELNAKGEFGAIQPTILVHGDRELQILCRSRAGKITECWSEDAGRTWTEMGATSLPNPNSGIDAVTLTDGRHLLVYNHTARGRSPLNVAVSDDGRAWSAALELENEPGEYSYPAVVQGPDGLVHMTYTYLRRRIKYVVVDPSQLRLRPIEGGRWPRGVRRD